MPKEFDDLTIEEKNNIMFEIQRELGLVTVTEDDIREHHEEMLELDRAHAKVY